MIKIANTEDFGFVCMCAVRYCLGRRTYAPGTVMGFIKTFIPALGDKTLYVMARDISEADNLGDAEIDAPMWAEFLGEIREEQKRRKNKLKPCPFCGGDAEINVDHEGVEDTEKRHWAYTVVCNRCCATSGHTYLPEKAREAWNRRAEHE